MVAPLAAKFLGAVTIALIGEITVISAEFLAHADRRSADTKINNNALKKTSSKMFQLPYLKSNKINLSISSFYRGNSSIVAS